MAIGGNESREGGRRLGEERRSGSGSQRKATTEDESCGNALDGWTAGAVELLCSDREGGSEARLVARGMVRQPWRLGLKVERHGSAGAVGSLLEGAQAVGCGQVCGEAGHRGCDQVGCCAWGCGGSCGGWCRVAWRLVVLDRGKTAHKSCMF